MRAIRSRADLSARALAAAAGVLADLALGEPPVRPHPVSAFGDAMARVEHSLYRPRRSAGVLHAATGLGFGVAAGVLVRSTALATYVAVAQRALCEAGLEVAAALDDDDLEGARRLLPTLVGRDPSSLDSPGIARAGGGVPGREHGRRRGGARRLGRPVGCARGPRLPGREHHGRQRRLSQRPLRRLRLGQRPPR